MREETVTVDSLDVEESTWWIYMTNSWRWRGG
jgi:hypothetical protein